MLKDLSDKIGRESTYKLTISKERLHLMLHSALATSIAMRSTYFPHKSTHKETWMSPNGIVKNLKTKVYNGYKKLKNSYR